MTSCEANWTDLNHRALVAAVGDIHAALQVHIARAKKGAPAHPPVQAGEPTLPPTTLDVLCSSFGLSSFERAIVLLCAGVELDPEIAGLCATAQGNSARPYPTFSLAMAALPDPHWSALTPAAPLRRWRLIEIAQQTGVPLVVSALSIDERVLHFLIGVQYTDERLAALIAPVYSEDLVPSHRTISARIVTRWTYRPSVDAGRALPLIQLCGADQAAIRSVAAEACREIGLNLYAMGAESMPSTAAELDAFVRLWERESTLTADALLLELDAVDRGERRAVSNISSFLERVSGPIILGARNRWRPLRRAIHTLDITKPTPQEQREVWTRFLGGASAAVNGYVDRMVSQFNLGLPAIRESVRSAVCTAAEGEGLAAELWRTGRSQSRPRLEDLAQRIETQASWDDLVLPEIEKSVLHEIAANVHHRGIVYGTWGFGVVGRGLGITALFSGTSGTGKTLACEVLANALSLDLYRIDLSSVVSKYIGETEKNLRRVFDAAEDGGAILFFDEADALFGKRSEVRDSHDRYANIEISYLLQRMEAYRGLAVLATNLKAALDSAFLRRIRFVVNFPFPSPEQRAEIWRRVFPPDTPVEGIDCLRLSRLDIAGGNIRNIALSAAFLAAEKSEPVRMPKIWQAARAEFAKLEKPFTPL
jgi:hypothetical protein